MFGYAAIAVVVAALPVIASRQAGWVANPDVVAKVAAARSTTNYEERRVPDYTLPDALTTRSGARVRTRADWVGRRSEILEAFRANVYGRSPARPDRLTFKTLERTPALEGAATLTRVAIISERAGRTHEFELMFFLPTARPTPAPVFLLINNRPVSNTDPTRKERSGFWPAEDLIARGYGIAALQYGDLAPDDKDHFSEGVIGFFEGTSAGPRPADAWGAIAAWAWGASRAMDYFVTDPRVEAAKIAVVGHSRGGKAALWTGAEDERFSLVVSNESGESGAALARRQYGETIGEITHAFPHWFNSTYATYAGREPELPVDQHMLLSLMAPRALYVGSADEDLWSDPRGEFLSLAASSPVFALFGDPAIRSDQMPALETPLVVARRGYHIRRGGHNLTPYDWARFADFADRVWR